MRKNYTPAYRREAADLVIDTGRPVVQVAREIGVGEALLGRWVAVERARTDHRPPDVLDVGERAELARLRTENAELQMDREFPKTRPPSSPPRIRTGRGAPADGRGSWPPLGTSVGLRSRMARLLNVSRSGYYDRARRQAAGRARRSSDGPT
jgi:transposase